MRELEKNKPAKKKNDQINIYDQINVYCHFVSELVLKD